MFLPFSSRDSNIVLCFHAGNVRNMCHWNRVVPVLWMLWHDGLVEMCFVVGRHYQITMACLFRHSSCTYRLFPLIYEWRVRIEEQDFKGSMSLLRPSNSSVVLDIFRANFQVWICKIMIVAMFISKKLWYRGLIQAFVLWICPPQQSTAVLTGLENKLLIMWWLSFAQYTLLVINIFPSIYLS